MSDENRAPSDSREGPLDMEAFRDRKWWTHGRPVYHAADVEQVLDALLTRLRSLTSTTPAWQVGCPVCEGTGELREAVLAWDVAGAPVPRCPHCDDGVLDLGALLTSTTADAGRVVVREPIAAEWWARLKEIAAREGNIVSPDSEWAVKTYRVMSLIEGNNATRTPSESTETDAGRKRGCVCERGWGVHLGCPVHDPRTSTPERTSPEIRVGAGMEEPFCTITDEQIQAAKVQVERTSESDEFCGFKIADILEAEAQVARGDYALAADFFAKLRAEVESRSLAKRTTPVAPESDDDKPVVDLSGPVAPGDAPSTKPVVFCGEPDCFCINEDHDPPAPGAQWEAPVAQRYADELERAFTPDRVFKGISLDDYSLVKAVVAYLRARAPVAQQPEPDAQPFRFAGMGRTMVVCDVCGSKRCVTVGGENACPGYDPFKNPRTPSAEPDAQEREDEIALLVEEIGFATKGDVGESRRTWKERVAAIIRSSQGAAQPREAE